jgi:uncharacterized protein Yka (UPF0111/DUF47 family)
MKMCVECKMCDTIISLHERIKNLENKPRTDVLLKDIDKEYERFENDIDEVQE